MAILRTAYDETIDPKGYTLACVEFVKQENGSLDMEMIWVPQNGLEITEADLPF